MVIGIIVFVLVLFIIGALFVNLNPEFGGSPSKEDIKKYELSGNYEKGKFMNLIPTSMDMDFGNMTGVLKKFIKGVPNSKPKFKIPVEKIDSLNLVQNDTLTKLIWFGHSTFLLQMDGKNILIDPMFGDVPAPHPWLGKKRYSKQLPIEIEKLPAIDLIIISHDHYDHLDYGSIKKLKSKTKKFCVPLGVGTHLKAWDIDPNMIHEFNWWESKQLDSINLVFAPARHFSGRGVSNRWSTLWGSWVVTGRNDNIYFSGDSGYGPHFKEIGDKYGPFDFAMMECGQYNENWAQIHMMPEETAQAALDLNTEIMMPIHWGAFTLALHSWTDPVERVTKQANKLNMPIAVPKIGETIVIGQERVSNDEWWVK